MSDCRSRKIASNFWRYATDCALILCFILFSGCTTVTTQSFDVTPNSAADASIIATGADFGKYDKLLADEMGIFMPAESPLPEDELARIRQIFRDAFLSQLDGYTIVDTPGPNVLKVQASLVDLRNSATSDLPQLRFEIRKMAKPGSLLFLMELRDSETDRVLGRAADNSEKSDPDATPTFAAVGSGETDWGSVEDAAKHWAELFRIFLDNNLNQ
jgi:hypothetical protein